MLIAAEAVVMWKRRREGRRWKNFEKPGVGHLFGREKWGPCDFRAERAFGNASIANLLWAARRP